MIDSGHGGDRVTALLASPGKTAPASDPEEDALAYLTLRRLANRHGCRGDRCPHQERRAGCAVHDADVEYLREWLRMLGMLPYESTPNPYWHPGTRAKASYRRP